MKLRTSTILSVALLTTAPALVHATATDWGVHDTLEVGAWRVDPGAFHDIVTFLIPSIADVSSTAVANNLLSLTSLEDGTVSLFQEAGATDTLIGSYVFDGTTGSVAHSFLSLPAGSYYYAVDGTATGSQGAFYSLASTSTAPVPEPGAALLLIGGATVMGLVVRRRRAGTTRGG